MNACINWDFTLWNKNNEIAHQELYDELAKIARKWTFQTEDAGSGEHYQGRMKLKVKKRLGEFSLFGAHLSRTSAANQNNDFYVCKDESRVAGPWRDSDVYITRQVREIDCLYEWQLAIERDIGVWNTRIINVIYDRSGCIGKSTLVGYLCQSRPDQVRSIPALNNYKDIMAMVLCMPTALMYLIDMPRGMDKTKQGEFFSAIESIKDGHAFDTRYTFKEKWFDSPNIWIFTNVIPDMQLLSADRWRLWTVQGESLRALRCNTNS